MKRTFAVALLVSLSVACRIPDLKPFSDATAAMATALKLGFERTEAALREAAETADDQSEFKKAVRELDIRWKPTRRAVSALVAYSDSLTSLAEAGKNGRQTMAELTDTVTELSAAVGAIPLTGTAAKVIETVGAKIIELQAERDIRKAVVKAAEAVDTLAPLLSDNFADLRRIHGAAARTWESRVQEQSSILTDYYDSLTGEETRLHHLLNLVNDYQSAPARLRQRAVRAKDAEQGKNLEASIAGEQAELLKRLQEFDALLGSMTFEELDAAAKVEARQQQLMALLNAHRRELTVLDAKYRQATADLNAVRVTRVTGEQVLEKGGDAILAWQKAHRSLLRVVQNEQSRPSIADLLSITEEIVSLLPQDATS